MSIKKQIKNLLNIPDLKINIKKETNCYGMDVTLNFTKNNFETFKGWAQKNKDYNKILKNLVKEYLKNTKNEICPDQYIFIDLKY